MRKQYFYITFLAALMLMAIGCKKEANTVTLGAVINKHAYDSKVYIDDHTPCWHNGDEVFINDDSYSIMASTGGTAQIADVTTSSAYRAVFPASIVNATDISSSSSIPVTLPSTQTYELVGNHQLVDVPMGAYITSGNTLQFFNLCSIVRVIVSNSLNQELPLSSIVLEAENAMLSGAGTATVSGHESDGITMLSMASHRVSLVFTADCPATVAARGTSMFDIVVPAFTTDNITITINTTNGQYFTLPKRKELSNNTITTVTPNVTGLTETPHAELVNGQTFRNAIQGGATSVVFEYNSSVTSGTLLSTADSPVPIYGNLDGRIWRVSTSASTIDANANSSYMFAARLYDDDDGYYYYPILETIDFGNGFNTSNVTDMSNMFNHCGLRSLDLSNFNTENVTNMAKMFCQCYSLTNLNLSSFRTGNVTDMSHMFSDCERLTSLDLSNFNTENVTNMVGMFYYCNSLTSLDLSNFNTENVTYMTTMFGYCTHLMSLDISSFNTENVMYMNSMFQSCSSLMSLNFSNFNTENVTSMEGMFYGCNNLTSLNLSRFNTGSVTNMSYMFSGCSSLMTLNLSSFRTGNVTDMSSMFSGCSSLMILKLSYFDMSRVASKSYMCNNLSTGTGHCTITCPSSVETAMRTGTNLPTSGVTFTWQRP